MISTNKKLYVNCVNDTTVQWPAIKLEVFMKTYIEKYFDVVSIFNIESTDLSKYELVIINATCFVTLITRVPDSVIFKQMDLLKSIKHVVLLTHDLHDYSFRFAYNPKKNTSKCKGYNPYVPVLYENFSKRSIKQFTIRYNITKIISIYDCPEFTYFSKFLTNVSNFYLINHGYPTHIFKPIACEKKYDVLFYGSNKMRFYPLRCRIVNLLKQINMTKPNGFRLRFITEKEKIREDQLAKIINESWLCISCVSIFSYLVRKYLEISACNSVIVGDTNPQGLQIFGNNMVFIDKTMTDDEIIDRITHYLTNKEILAALSFNKLSGVQAESYSTYADKLNTIGNTVVTNTQCQYNLKNYTNNVVNYATTHTKIKVNLTFENIDNNMMLSNLIEPGLYVIIYNTNIIDAAQSQFDIYTPSNLLLTKPDTWISDIACPTQMYVSFKLTVPIKLKMHTNNNVSICCWRITPC